jgi:DNA replication and repair protein RecF
MIEMQRDCVSEIFYDEPFDYVKDWSKAYDLGNVEIDNWQDLYNALAEKSKDENERTELLNKLAYDLISKTTNIGLHRDDFEIKINDKDISSFGSEGQMRNTILAIKLAIMEIYKKENKDIILLLDDVFASIDQKRINKIMEYIKLEKQTFITTTSLFNIPDELLKEAKIIKL